MRLRRIAKSYTWAETRELTLLAAVPRNISSLRSR